MNITPDSFSDGGRFLDPQAALRRIIQLSEDGADIIDIGAESSRPGAQFVSIDDEWNRLEPVLQLLNKENSKIHMSVDTNKAEIMTRLADYDVKIVNDIRGGADDRTLEQLAKKGMIYLAMHMFQTPASMQETPISGREAVLSVNDFYQTTHTKLLNCGFRQEDIWLDPGIGFGKDDKANYLLLQDSYQQASKRHIVIGISRKSFLGRTLDLEEPHARDAPSKMLEFSFLAHNVKAIRTHDVKTLSKIRAMIE